MNKFRKTIVLCLILALSSVHAQENQFERLLEKEQEVKIIMHPRDNLLPEYPVLPNYFIQEERMEQYNKPFDISDLLEAYPNNMLRADDDPDDKEGIGGKDDAPVGDAVIIILVLILGYTLFIYKKTKIKLPAS